MTKILFLGDHHSNCEILTLVIMIAFWSGIIGVESNDKPHPELEKKKKKKLKSHLANPGDLSVNLFGGHKPIMQLN